MKLKRIGLLVASVGALMATVMGARQALKSQMFTVRLVEVEGQATHAPVEADTITSLAAVPVGKQNLFELQLQDVERRILSHEWIRDVRLSKRFPQTVVISVSFRDPRAVIQFSDGHLAYVDANGQTFGKVDLALDLDLPVLVGFGGDSPESRRRIIDALTVISTWSQASLANVASLASIDYEADRGIRAYAVYPYSAGGRARVAIDLGDELKPDLASQLGQLDQIFRYLIAHRLAARQIWADSAKKMVVRIAGGS